jgi:hypothetical protein
MELAEYMFNDFVLCKECMASVVDKLLRYYVR